MRVASMYVMRLWWCSPYQLDSGRDPNFTYKVLVNRWGKEAVHRFGFGRRWACRYNCSRSCHVSPLLLNWTSLRIFRLLEKFSIELRTWLKARPQHGFLYRHSYVFSCPLPLWKVRVLLTEILWMQVTIIVIHGSLIASSCKYFLYHGQNIFVNHSVLPDNIELFLANGIKAML